MAFAYCCILCVCCRISLFGRVTLKFRSIELSSHYPQSYIPSFRWCSFLFPYLCTKTLGIVCHGVQAFVLTHFFRGVRRFFFVLIFISVWLFRFSSGHIKGKTRCGVLSEHIFFFFFFFLFWIEIELSKICSAVVRSGSARLGSALSPSSSSSSHQLVLWNCSRRENAINPDRKNTNLSKIIGMT